jgi:hypothetical protein
MAAGNTPIIDRSRQQLTIDLHCVRRGATGREPGRWTGSRRVGGHMTLVADQNRNATPTVASPWKKMSPLVRTRQDP